MATVLNSANEHFCPHRYIYEMALTRAFVPAFWLEGSIEPCTYYTMQAGTCDPARK